MVTETQVRELGKKIYDERARLAAEPEVSAPGAVTERQQRIEQLDIAAQLNGIALQHFSNKCARV